MQCDEIEIQLPSSGTCLNGLDNALNELGMLASRTKSREEYLSEIQNKEYLNMLTINTRYVSNVSIGLKVRPMAPHVRYNPYKIPKERHRTKSENNDSDIMFQLCDPAPVLEETITKVPLDHIQFFQLKKAKSLESILAEANLSVDFNKINIGTSSELEVVSNCIQNLKVDE